MARLYGNVVFYVGLLPLLCSNEIKEKGKKTFIICTCIGAIKTCYYRPPYITQTKRYSIYKNGLVLVSFN